MLIKILFFIVESLVLAIPFWLALIIFTHGFVRLGTTIQLDKKKSFLLLFLVVLILDWILTSIFGPEIVILYHIAFYTFIGAIIARIILRILASDWLSKT